MSLDAFVWAARLPVDVCATSPYRVLLILADHAGQDGRNAFPSVAAIAATLSCSRRTVQRALRDLEILGLTRRGDQRLVDHIRGDKRPVVWDLQIARFDHRSGVTELSLDGVTELSRGDRSGLNGVTTVDAQGTVLNQITTTQGNQETARASDARRECPNSRTGHRFELVGGIERCMACSMDREQAAEYARGVR